MPDDWNLPSGTRFAMLDAFRRVFLASTFILAASLVAHTIDHARVVATG
jgi:hypothetical protein